GRRLRDDDGRGRRSPHRPRRDRRLRLRQLLGHVRGRWDGAEPAGGRRRAGRSAPTEGRPVAPGSMERPAVNTLMVVPNPQAPAPGTGGGGSGSGSGSKSGGTTPTTASPRVTVAGGGSGPAGGLVGAPAPNPAGGGSGGAGVPSGAVMAGIPTTIRPLRLTGGAGPGKAKNAKGGP